MISQKLARIINENAYIDNITIADMSEHNDTKDYEVTIKFNAPSALYGGNERELNELVVMSFQDNYDSETDEVQEYIERDIAKHLNWNEDDVFAN